MQQDTAARPDPVTKPYGRYEITAQITVDGGYSITTMTRTGGNREHQLCFTVADRDTYRTIYAVIREGGLNHVHPDGVCEAIRDALTWDLHEMQRRRDTPSRVRADEINRLLDRLTSPADQQALDALAADLGRPRSFRELRTRTAPPSTPTVRRPADDRPHS